MTSTPDAPPAPPVEQLPAPVAAAPQPAPRRRGSLADTLGVSRFSGLYGLVLVIAFFGVTEPDLFLTETNLKVTLVNSAITGLLAMGVLVPLVAGQLDLSFGSVAGFAMVFFAWASTHSGANSYVLALATILLCGLFGLTSGLLTAFFRLNSLIVTLGVSSVALGATEFVTKGNTLVAQLDSSFTNLGLGSLGAIPVLAVILVVLAALVYVWLEHTPSGRFVLASGNNPNAARLVGINVPRIQLTTLLFSSLVSGLAGVLIVARVGSATDTGAGGYLLPVIAGIFLGSTQLVPRPNVVGTLIAVYLLGTGVQGIQLHGGGPWVNEMFNGVVLLVAISVAALRGRALRHDGIEEPKRPSGAARRRRRLVPRSWHGPDTAHEGAPA